MPLYADAAAVQRHAGGAARLTEISDFDHNGDQDSGLVDLAIDSAEALIHSYSRKLYEVPFTVTIPPIIIEVAASLAVYNLKCWRDALTEQDVLKYEQNVEWLTNLSKGLVDLGISPAPPVSGHVRATNTARPTSKAVSREKLKGFS